MAGQERTEKPTPQRLREARKRGDVPSSPEFASSVVAVVSLFVLQGQGATLVNGLMALLSHDLVLSGTARHMSDASVGTQLRSDVLSGLLLLMPVALAVMVGAVAIGVLNTRGLVSFTPLKPSFRKLNVVKGFKHLISKDSLILLLKTVTKLLIVVVVDAWAPSWQALVPGLAVVPMGDALGRMWHDSVGLAIQLTVAFAVVGAIDFGYRYFSWYRRQRMTKQEVKEEFKRSEGNPQMRSRLRSQGRKRIRALIAANGLRRVPQADVVITNPTHFAIAIQYKAGSMRAPRVIAKGQHLMALRIKDMARRHNIPMVENKPLAQALYKSVEVNQEIPADLYQAVAQVLAFVYRMRAPLPAPPRRRRVGSLSS